MNDRDLIDELAKVIYPEAFADDAADIVEDVPVARAEARLYASRVAEWLNAHDRVVAERAYERFSLEAGTILLRLIPRNPYRTD